MTLRIFRKLIPTLALAGLAQAAWPLTGQCDGKESVNESDSDISKQTNIKNGLSDPINREIMYLMVLNFLKDHSLGLIIE